MQRVILISQGSPFTGINKYAINTHLAFMDKSSLYFLKFRKDHGGYPVGNTINGKYPLSNFPVNLNSLFPRHSYAKFIENVSEQKENGSLVHICSPNVLPIFANDGNILTIHDDFFMSFKNSLNLDLFLMKRLFKQYKNFRQVLTVSNHIKDHLNQIMPGSDITVVYPYISDTFKPLSLDKSHFRRKYNLPLDKKLIISISTGIRRKNINILSSVVKKLGDNYRIVRVGIGIPGSINLQPKDEIEMNEILNASDVFVSPSLDEGFGYPVLEAMKSGISTAISNIDVYKEVSGDFSEYFDPQNIDSMSRAIVNAIDEPTHTKNEKFRWLNNYSKENFVNNMTRVYT